MGNDRQKQLTAIDLFCGAGGFTLAAVNLCIQTLAAVEIDKYACETYKYNFIKKKKYKISPKLYNENIFALSPEQLMSDIELNPKELDILMGGPPCQGFSQHRIKNSGVDDPKNELLLRYFDYVKAIKPKVFIVENVRGMLWPKHINYINKFYKLALENGYDVKPPEVLDAKDYGVPQNRKRVFVLGVRVDCNLDVNWPLEKTHFNPKSKEAKKHNKPTWKTARDIFEKEIIASDPNNLHMKPSEKMVERFMNTPPDGGSRADSGFILPCHSNGYAGHKDVYGRMRFDTPANTITAGCTNPSKGRFVHPTEHHGITARHCARFQTFPDNFIFKGGLGNAGKQIGNAVPIILGEAVLKTIKQTLEAGNDN